jgi:hypothetical protein
MNMLRPSPTLPVSFQAQQKVGQLADADPEKLDQRSQSKLFVRFTSSMGE